MVKPIVLCMCYLIPWGIPRGVAWGIPPRGVFLRIPWGIPHVPWGGTRGIPRESPGECPKGIPPGGHPGDPPGDGAAHAGHSRLHHLHNLAFSACVLRGALYFITFTTLPRALIRSSHGSAWRSF